ncbi:MAG: tRNA (adenosine(37)-N6)-threonylcarbamoyltransferase complex ATPase subunit type 1 TsaE [Planktomarina sp.]|nr:tRNA (adenosine(37)-N6)-threonylcarbamoyltransferase complex ATPase subunit type 1 TsaE [Planktomarina sp.]
MTPACDLESSVPVPWRLTVKTEAMTAEIAASLAELLGPGDVVLLQGGLAAGKTFFTRHLVQALGTRDDISSPTYMIANIYQTKRCDVLHVDAYRLSGAQEFHNLGLEEEIETSISVIEWGGRIVEAFDAYLHITFTAVPEQDGARVLEVAALGRRAHRLLAQFHKRYSCEWL